MKKVSVYFTDRQVAMLEAHAAHVGITFAEALRRMLDAWLAHQERTTVQQSLDELAAQGPLLNYRLRSGTLLRDATKPEIEEEMQVLGETIQALGETTTTKKPHRKKRS